MNGTCKTKIQIAIMHGISGGGESIPSTPSSGKFSLMELIKLFIRIEKLLLKWQTNKKSLSNLVLGKKIVDPRVVSICTWSHASE